MKRLCCCAGLLIGLVVFAACDTLRPNIQSNTPEPLVTLVTLAPTMDVPTVTPTPVSTRLKNLRFSTSGDISAAQPSGTIFDAGQPTMYAVVDYVNWPANTLVKVEVRHNGIKSPLSAQPWGDHITGTGVLTIPLITDSRQLIPRLYRTTIQAAGETLEGVFRISQLNADPGTVLITETFEDNVHGMLQWSWADSSGSIKDGRYQLTTVVTSYLTAVALPIGLDNFDAAFEIQRDPASTDAIVGCLLRSGGERGAYAFEVTSDGHWSFERVAPVVRSLIDSGQNATAIKAGEAVNRFRIIGQGNRFIFYANGIKLGEIIEDRFNLKSGSIAPGVRSPTGKAVTVWIDNASVALPEIPTVTTRKLPPAPSAMGAFAGQMREAAQAVLQIEALLGEAQRELDAATCAEIMPRFYQAVNIALPDVTDQSSDIKREVRSYERVVQEMDKAAPPVQKICEAGGGRLESAEYDEFTSAIRLASEIFWGVYIETR